MLSFPARAIVYTAIAAGLGLVWFLALQHTTMFAALVTGEAARNEVAWTVCIVIASVGSAWLSYPLLIYSKGWVWLFTWWAQLALGIVGAGLCWDAYIAITEGRWGAGMGLVVVSPFLIFASPWVLLYAAAYTWMTKELARWTYSAWLGADREPSQDTYE